VAGKKSGNVLNEHPSTGPNKVIGDPGELEEQAGSLASGESGSASGDAEVLAGEAATQQIDCASIPFSVYATPSVLIPSIMPSRGVPICSSPQPHTSYVVVAGHSGPVLGDDASAPLIPLALEDDPHSGSLQSEVDAADAAEQRSGIHPRLPNLRSSLARPPRCRAVNR
jgi:hypothetical protein